MDSHFYINGTQTFADVSDNRTCWHNRASGNDFCFSR